MNHINAQCGTLSVFENRAASSGRKIDIHVAVIKARASNPYPDPIFYLAGGPGGSAIGDASYALLLLKSANERRDIVLVDQRGTGQSNRLTCPRQIDESVGLIPIDDQMVQDFQDCLENLDADPSAYTTAWGMDDVDDVRTVLGYDQINLYGESYGTMASEVYLQRHGNHVRTMTIEGVTLLDVPIFEKMPHSSQLALNFLIERCQMDPTCSSAYPNFAEETLTVISRVEKQPVELPINNPRPGKPIKMNRSMLALGIHGALVNTETAVLLPHLIHQAYQGNWNEIAQFYADDLSEESPDAEWKIMNINILCHENWAKFRPMETAEYSSSSYLKYEDVRRFLVPAEFCAVMPTPPPAAMYQPVKSSPVPVLLISDGADPQNPPENVADATERYPNSLTVIAPGQGHGYTGLDCRERFVSTFIESGTTKDLDTSCLQKVPLPGFNVSE
jgi:pimeloyl-ACP methyl ester carboxylesterase